MNINEFTPKHVNLADMQNNAKTYTGTFTELYDLVKTGDVTLVTNADGDVTGFWVESHAENQMMDTLAGMNFNNAYCCKPVMEWLEIILKAKAKEIMINETTGEAVVDGNLIKLPGYSHGSDSCDETSDLPDYVEIDTYDVDDTSLSSIRHYLKKTYGHCLARGTQPTITDDGDLIIVEDIEWGRPLSQVELAAL